MPEPYPYGPQDPFGDSDIDPLLLRAIQERVAQLMDEIGLQGSIRSEMLASPREAYPVLIFVVDMPHTKSRAIQARRWWAKRKPEPRPAPLAGEGPPTLSALEFAWSRDTLPDGEPNPAVTALLKLMAAAITRHGGFAQLQAQMRERQWFDPRTGELLHTFRDP